jgi:dUTP diphosphatase
MDTVKRSVMTPSGNTKSLAVLCRSFRVYIIRYLLALFMYELSEIKFRIKMICFPEYLILVAYLCARIMELQVQIINKSPHVLPAYQTDGSSGMDLRAWLTEPVTLQPLARKLIPTGLYIALPHGFEAQIRPRSGLAIKKGLTLINTPGTIDSDYRGEVMVAMVNLGNEEQVINDGERIAQMIVSKYEVVKWECVEALEETKRGAGGFGHSGTM